jgi:DNA-binding FadR family transcriptional regulator
MTETLKRQPADREKAELRRTKHRQVFEYILADIESGKLKEGERLPSEIELVKEFATSRPTVAHALRDLQIWDWLNAKSGRAPCAEVEAGGFVALWAIDTRAWQH